MHRRKVVPHSGRLPAPLQRRKWLGSGNQRRRPTCPRQRPRRQGNLRATSEALIKCKVRVCQWAAAWPDLIGDVAPRCAFRAAATSRHRARSAPSAASFGTVPTGTLAPTPDEDEDEELAMLLPGSSATQVTALVRFSQAQLCYSKVAC